METGNWYMISESLSHCTFPLGRGIRLRIRFNQAFPPNSLHLMSPRAIAATRQRLSLNSIFRPNRTQSRKKLRSEDAQAIWRCFGEFDIQHALMLGAAQGYHRSTIYRCIRLEGAIPEAWKLPIRLGK
jgi:hypothetical protein